jgi:hypothetical protein
VSVVLLAGAGLLTRTMLRLAEVDTGLGTEEVLTIQVAAPDTDGDHVEPRGRWRGKGTLRPHTR